MNCPHHCEIYKSEPRSYKDLPLRFAEFGTVYRYEQSGELHGLTRVRGFTQDDAHIFVMPNQLVFIVTTAAALPSGSQTYYFSYRYNSLQKIISSNIVLSTFVSFFTLSFKDFSLSAKLILKFKSKLSSSRIRYNVVNL